MNKFRLTFLLDVLSCDLSVSLYLKESNNELIGTCKVYELPSKHDMNEYYGHYVEEIRVTHTDRVVIFVTKENK